MKRMNDMTKHIVEGPARRMENMRGIRQWQSDDELQGHSKVSQDRKWLVAISKLAEQSRSNGVNNLDNKKGTVEISLINNNNQKNNDDDDDDDVNDNNNNSSNMNNCNAVDKRFKTLPAIERLPRKEVLGGYIFVCNNDTMKEDLNRRLFGLPPRYRDSVRAIIPGLPLFLYNYSTHQLHGIFEASSFGGFEIDPTAWEDEECKGESKFPAQVRTRVRKLCKPLGEGAFRPVLHHYYGSKFRLELSVPETLDLLDLCEKAGSSA